MKLALKIVAILLIICATSVTTALVMKKLYPDTKQTSITSEFVEQQISEISELATLHHHYRKNANYQDAKKLLEYMPDWRINKSIKEFTLVYQGDVKLGYDLKDIKILVEPNSQNIFIYLPEPKILSHSIDFESIQVLWEKQGWFNNIRFEDFKQFFISEQKKYEQENSAELKRRAREHAMKLIQLRLGTTIESGYKVNLEQRDHVQEIPISK
jgi:hypothetical protein